MGLWCGRWSPELLCVVGDGYIWDYCVADALLNCCVVGGEYIWGYGVAGGLLYCCMWEEVDISGIIVLQVVFCTAVCGMRWIYLGLLCGRCSYVLLCGRRWIYVGVLCGRWSYVLMCEPYGTCEVNNYIVMSYRDEIILITL